MEVRGYYTTVENILKVAKIDIIANPSLNLTFQKSLLGISKCIFLRICSFDDGIDQTRQKTKWQNYASENCNIFAVII